MTERLFSCDADIARVTAGFLDHSLPKREWTHAAHFAVAFALLRDPSRDAVTDMPDLIRRYNEACGTANPDTTGYHETITLASLRAASLWLESHPALALHESLNALLRSPFGHADWLLSYWSRDA